jgi:RNA-directed DNA polymerase
MKAPHIEGVATHDDPESCVSIREDGGEAVTGAHAGPVWSRENKQSGAPTPLSEAEGNTTGGRYREPPGGPARSETRSTCGTFLRENREVPESLTADGAVGRTGKAQGRTPVMHDSGKSDRSVVLTITPNKTGQPAEEAEKGRDLAKGNTSKHNASRTQRRTYAHNALERVREAAKRGKRMRFTALFHHVDIDRLRGAFYALKKDAAPGVDGVAWAQYAEHLEDNLQVLHARLHQGAYRARPSRRAYIPKPDGRQRSLGIAALEDKLVQRAVVDVLNAIYETDFLGFSYGFRPKRRQHDALAALAVGIMRREVNWVLDADIRGFFDAIDHGWLMKFVEHRVADRRILRLIQKWLTAGVMEKGSWTQITEGSPQGATVSPLLANLYLHYVIDLWVQQWRTRRAAGDMVVVRYADDFIVGFQHRTDAERFLEELQDRLAKFRLELNADKTRLIKFGKRAHSRQKGVGEGRPGTFSFLGFTHICGRTRNGKRFLLLRHTIRQRMTAKLHEVRAEIQRRRHEPISIQGRWLASIVRGHCAYYGVPTNSHAIDAFRTGIAKHWYRSLRRRGQRRRITWDRMRLVIARWLPSANIAHPWPDEHFNVRTRGKSPVR